MKAGDTVYWGMIWNGRPQIERVRITKLTPGTRGGSADITVLESIHAAPGYPIAPPTRSAQVYVESDEARLCPTLSGLLDWLIGRASARLAEQERAVAQTRETLAELRVMLEGVEG